MIKVEQELERRRAKASLYEFTKFMWNVIEPETEFVDGWHIKAKCDHLEAVTRFEIPKLIINEPPRHMKSIVTCVMWPAWVWGYHPERSFIFGSHSVGLAARDSIKCRQIIKSEEYKRVFGIDWDLRSDGDTTTLFVNTVGGARRSVGVGSSVTGQGGDYLIVDDPHDAGEIYSEPAREKVKFWHDKVLSSRVNNPKRFARVVIMQRLHEEDLTGHLLDKKDGQYDHLCLAGEFNPDAEIKSKTSLGFIDPRTEKDEILWPERFSPEALIDMKEDLEEEAEAQINQDPKPSKGGLFPRDNWKIYLSSPSTILEVVQFVDAAQKPGVSNDYSVIATWAKTQSGYYLLDLLREKTDAPLLESLTIGAFNKWKPHAIVIEDKSAGSSLIQYLRTQTTLPVIAFDPLQRDKVVRATAATPTVRAGKCHLPKEIWGTEVRKGKTVKVNLVKSFISEHESFPKSKNDDTVDTTSMMVEYFLKMGIAEPRVRRL